MMPDVLMNPLPVLDSMAGNDMSKLIVCFLLIVDMMILSDSVFFF